MPSHAADIFYIHLLCKDLSVQNCLSLLIGLPFVSCLKQCPDFSQGQSEFFAVAVRGQRLEPCGNGGDLTVIWYHLMSLPGPGEWQSLPLPRRKAFLPSEASGLNRPMG